MINRSVESFLRTSYGDALWLEVLRTAQVDQQGFLAMAGFDDRATRRVVYTAARLLGKPIGELVEDLGAWLVQLEPVRRLLRFSGPDFIEFVLSLEDLPGRARMILPELPVNNLAVIRNDCSDFTIGADSLPSGWVWALAGALRGMADDYGTLALIAVSGNWITLQIALADHTTSRPFELSPFREMNGFQP